MYDTAQTGPATLPYRSPTMRLFRDLILVPCASPGKTCEASEVMMARVQPTGMFELLSAAAWVRALGYALDELSGKSLCELMPLEKPAAGELVAALLDKKDFQSLEVTLCCKDERRKSFRFHRRFDPYQDAMYVVADELPAERAAPIRAGRLARMDALGTFAAEQTGCGPRSSVSDERRVTLPDGLQPGLP